jgi:ribosomal protein S27AE
MSSHLDKDEYYILEVLNRLTSSRSTTGRKRLLEFVKGTYTSEVIHIILDGLRRKEMLISIGKKNYQLTNKGKQTLLGKHAEDKRHKETFGICAECQNKNILTFFAKRYICSKCLTVDLNPINIEDYIYCRASSEHTYPSSFTSSKNSRITERKRGKKKSA